MESLLYEANIRSRQTRVTAQKGFNFWSDRWIVLKFLQEIMEAIFSWSNYGISTLWSERPVTPDESNASKEL